MKPRYSQPETLVNIMPSLANLTDNRTYYYRAKASGHGIVYGLEESFTTKAQGQLPVAATDDATNATYVSARLNGTVTSLGTSQSTEVRFTWGTTPGVYTASQSLIVNTVGPIYFDAVGLLPNTTYYYHAHITYSLGPEKMVNLQRALNDLSQRVLPLPHPQRQLLRTAAGAVLAGEEAGRHRRDRV